MAKPSVLTRDRTVGGASSWISVRRGTGRGGAAKWASVPQSRRACWKRLASAHNPSAARRAAVNFIDDAARSGRHSSDPCPDHGAYGACHKGAGRSPDGSSGCLLTGCARARGKTHEGGEDKFLHQRSPAKTEARPDQRC